MPVIVKEVIQFANNFAILWNISTEFFEKEGKHNLKHIHVRYHEYKACYDLDGNLIEGKLPIKQKN